MAKKENETETNISEKNKNKFFLYHSANIVKKFIEKKSELLAGIILMVMLLLMIGSAQGDSLTRDELAHIVSGYSYLTQHDYRLNPEHPPLVKDLAALPLLSLNPKFPSDHPAWTKETNSQWTLGEIFLFKMGNDADSIIFWSRVPIMLLAILLGIYVFKFTRKLAGDTAALTALALTALSPNIIAHSRLVTTDLGIAAFALISFYYFWKFLKAPTWKNLIIMAFIFGLTHLAKFSSPLLIPVFGLMLVLASFDNSEEAWPHIKLPLLNRLKYQPLKRLYVFTTGFALITIIAYSLVGVYYSLHLVNMPLSVQHQLINDSINSEPQNQIIRTALHAMADNPVLRPYSQYALGFVMVFLHSSGGHTTFFIGQIGRNWWNYYFVAYLIKEPIPSQLIFYLATIFAFWMGARSINVERKNSIRRTVLGNLKNLMAWLGRHNMEISAAAFISILVVTGMTSKLQLGIRYMLPIFPLLYVLMAVVCHRFLATVKNKNFLPFYYTTFVFLILWLGIASVSSYPSYIAYYNEFIGGPKNGYKYLVDSNTDWGQDLKRLVKFTEENKIDKIKVDYFGGANPEYYLKDKYIPWGFDKGPTTGWIAVSASALQWNRGIPEDGKVKSPEYNYHWLDKYTPAAQIGYSILVYKIE